MEGKRKEREREERGRKEGGRKGGRVSVWRGALGSLNKHIHVHELHINAKSQLSRP